MSEPKSAETGTDFIRRQVAADLESDRYGGRVVTRFPPEPNGYLHVGHASHICLNFGIAEEFGGQCHLRYDDTNPETENEEFVRAIQEDIRWLGFDWGPHLYYASDYFARMYDCAESLIEKGLAYVDSQPSEAIREGRGSVTEPGVASPYRDRTPEENLDLFRRMRAGEFEDGAHVLRGKIDMASPNMLMRDPVFYRIRHAHHFRQGDDWCIYPLYDFAHCLEDAFEDVTHSLCTLEFDNNRELYDWVLENTGFHEPRPHQYEWAGLDLENSVLSKRKIKPLVDAGVVSGWDDPRLSTITAYRRRGVPPEALRVLAKMVGVSKSGGTTEESKLDYAIREVLNPVAPRVMAVLDPLKVVLTNYGADEGEEFDAPYFPPDVDREGSRSLPFGAALWIERSDFEEDPPEGFRRLVPGGEVRLKYAYVIRCDEVVKDESGEVIELRCSYDPETRGGSVPDGRKVKGTIHWVAAETALEAEVRLFSALFGRGGIQDSDPGHGVADDEAEDPHGNDYSAFVDPNSLAVRADAKLEPSVAHDAPDTRYQFERTGYFWRDPTDGADRLVFNRIVELKSTYDRGAVEAATTRPKGSPAPDIREEKVRGPSVAPKISEERDRVRADDPELAARFERYQERGIQPALADVLTASRARSDFFEAALGVHDDPSGVAAWVATDLRGLIGERSVDELPIDGAALGRLAALVDAGGASRRAGKDVLAKMVEEGGEAADWVEQLGLASVSDTDELGGIVDEVLAAWPDKVEAYRAGNANLLGMFIGEVMKATRGAADPQSVRTLLAERLDA